MQRARSQPRRLSEATPLLPTQLLVDTHVTNHGETPLPGGRVSYLRYANGLSRMAERDRLDHKLSVNLSIPVFIRRRKHSTPVIFPRPRLLKSI